MNTCITCLCLVIVSVAYLAVAVLILRLRYEQQKDQAAYNQARLELLDRQVDAIVLAARAYAQKAARGF